MNEEKSIRKLFVIADFVVIVCCLVFLAITVYITNQNQANKIFYFNGTNVWQSPSFYIVAIICLLIFPIILFLQLKKTKRIRFYV
jgi:cytochrome bd-type quinol oxidase subunit 2